MEPGTMVLGVLVAIVGIYLIYSIIAYFFFNDFAALSGLNIASEGETVVKSSRLNASGTGNYTYSIWLYVQDWNYGFGTDKNLFVRRRNSDSEENALRVYMDAEANNLIIETLCFDNSSPTGGIHTCQVDNFPLQTWVNLTISQYGRTCDIYIDGKLVRSCVLPATAIVANGDAIITPENYGSATSGFSGYTCKFRCLSYATNPQQAYNIYKSGPCSSGSFGYRLRFEVLKGAEPRYTLTL